MLKIVNNGSEKNHSMKLTRSERVLFPLCRVRRRPRLVGPHVRLGARNTITVPKWEAVGVIVEPIQPHRAIVLYATTKRYRQELEQF
jgi:hypothetical protein